MLDDWLRATCGLAFGVRMSDFHNRAICKHVLIVQRIVTFVQSRVGLPAVKMGAVIFFTLLLENQRRRRGA